MLTESTGIAMMDSGGEEGRHWQRNQKKTIRDFENDEVVTLDYEIPCTTDDVLINVSLFHYLPTVLELDDLCEAFNALPCKDWDSENAYGLSKRGEAFLVSAGFDFGESWNTYNGEDNLSQTLQGTNLKRDGLSEGDYILLQIHNGADVRGGYTNAKLFKLQSFQEFLNPTPYVTATLTKKNGEKIELDTGYLGYKLSGENGESVAIEEGDRLEASLMDA